MAKPLLDRIMLVAAKTHAKAVLKRFYAAVHNATAVQQRVLLEKIRRNADSEYGAAHIFRNIHSYQSFKRQVPLQTYDDIEPYVDRVKGGNFRALFGEDQTVRMFALTSGSASAPKFVPVTDHFLREFRAGWNAFGIQALMDHPGYLLTPILQISSRMDESMTEAGIPCGAITGLMASTQKRLVRKYYINPLWTAYIEDPLSRYYTIMRLSIVAPRIGFMVTANPATQLMLAKAAAQHGAQMIRDVHDGTLWSELDVPDALRQKLSGRLRRAPQRAEQLQQILDCHGRLLPKHFWDLGFLCNWTGGTMGLYLKDFHQYFGDVPVRDIGLIASEGRMSIPVQDGTPAGILDVTCNFYEFIPATQENTADPDCLRSHEVEIGQEYFIVLTNSAGFYRYCIGDQVRVVGFEGQAPLIEFLHKGGRISSIAGEKLTEHQAVEAVQAAAAEALVPIQNFVLAPRFGDPPYYVLHVDPRDALTAGALDRFCTAVDRHLASMNVEYASKQSSLRLGLLQLNLLPAGFLEERDRHLSVRYRSSNEQYKHQFLLGGPGQDDDWPIRPNAVADDPAPQPSRA